MEENNKLIVDDTYYETKFTKKFLTRKKYNNPDPKKVYSFIPGVIRKIYIKKGQVVKKNDKLLVLEAMKMQNDITASIDGKISNILVSEEQKVAKNELLIEFE